MNGTSTQTPRSALLPQMAAMLGVAVALGFVFNSLSPLGAHSGKATEDTLSIGRADLESGAGKPAVPQAAAIPSKGYHNDTLSIRLENSSTPALAGAASANPASAGAGAAANAPKSASPIREVTWAEVKASQASAGTLLIDARPASNFQAGHIPRAISIPGSTTDIELAVTMERYPKVMPITVIALLPRARNHTHLRNDWCEWALLMCGICEEAWWNTCRTRKKRRRHRPNESHCRSQSTGSGALDPGRAVDRGSAVKDCEPSGVLWQPAGLSFAITFIFAARGFNCASVARIDLRAPFALSTARSISVGLECNSVPGLYPGNGPGVGARFKYFLWLHGSEDVRIKRSQRSGKVSRVGGVCMHTRSGVAGSGGLVISKERIAERGLERLAT